LIDRQYQGVRFLPHQQVLKTPRGRAAIRHKREASTGVDFQVSLHAGEVPVNALFEHHKDNIRLGYRCFDRILLNGLIQPFQQPECVVGFFNTYRQLYPVSRDVLREIANQFHCWVLNRSRKWDASIERLIVGK